MYVRPRREKAGKHPLTDSTAPAYHGGMNPKMALPTAAASCVTQAILPGVLLPATENGPWKPRCRDGLHGLLGRINCQKMWIRSRPQGLSTKESPTCQAVAGNRKSPNATVLVRYVPHPREKAIMWF